MWIDPKDLWDNNKNSNVRVIRVWEGEDKGRDEKIFEEIFTRKFPNPVKGINLQIAVAQKTPNRTY